ncbi:hypothetical protein [Streptomyces triculaminicus]|uniref:hypothetical protein n=1 Tax=Streptomyces triculaminicus TaxID=2816232 RepID=UPI0037B2DCF7
MAGLPMRWTTWAVSGSQWAVTFELRDDNGAPMNISGKAFEFVVRPTAADTTTPPLIKVTTVSSAQGCITVDTTAATVQVVLSPAATALLGRGARAHALWMDPALPTAENLVEGTFNSLSVSAA